jgi:Cys-rich repeat protein
MGRQGQFAAAATALLLLVACGELQNERLRVATVKGRVIGAGIASGGLVLVQERTELRAPLEADGRFEVRGVPAGTTHLYVMTPEAGGVIREVVARGGQVVDLGEIELLSGASLTVAVTIAGGFSASQGTVTVFGTHHEAQPIGVDERAFFAPLPAGCYEVQTSVPSIGFQAAQACIEPGVAATISVLFASANAGVPFAGGCSQIGCVVGRQCIADGRCVQCTQNLECGNGQVCDGQGRCVGCTQSSDCAQGLTCDFDTNECVGALAPCSLCTSDKQCGEGKCEVRAGEPAACLYPCGSSSTCADPGFVCESGLCVPDPVAYRGCLARRKFGMACSGDPICVDQGLVEGVCAASQCTTRCSSSAICPAGYSCTSVGGVQVCAVP